MGLAQVKNGSIEVVQIKTGKYLLIPMHPDLAEVLSVHEHPGGGFEKPSGFEVFCMILFLLR